MTVHGFTDEEWEEWDRQYELRTGHKVGKEKKEKEDWRAKLVIPKIAVVITEPTSDMFLSLTEYTCPNGFEEEMYDTMLRDLGWTKDGDGNYYFLTSTTSTTVFTAHLDTADYAIPHKVNHMFREDPTTHSIFARTDGSSILGADDKAGVAILLKMAHVHKVPGLYMLFVGEECGGIGSMAAAKTLKEAFYKTYKRIVSFDRRGYDSVITHQSGGRSASQVFATELSERLNTAGKSVGWAFRYAPDSGGTFTDSASFMEGIPECTNISVGYSGAHMKNEEQDLSFLDALSDAVALVDWETLPTERDPSVREVYRYNTGGWGWSSGQRTGGDSAWYGDGDYSKSYTPKTTDTTSTTPRVKKGNPEDFIKATRPYYEPMGAYKKLQNIVDAKDLEYNDLYQWVLENSAAATDILLHACTDWPGLPSYAYGKLRSDADDQVWEAAEADLPQIQIATHPVVVEESDEPIGSDVPPDLTSMKTQRAIQTVMELGLPIRRGVDITKEPTP